MSVWFISIHTFAVAEGLGVCLELDVSFDSDDRFELVVLPRLCSMFDLVVIAKCSSRAYGRTWVSCCVVALGGAAAAAEQQRTRSVSRDVTARLQETLRATRSLDRARPYEATAALRPEMQKLLVLPVKAMTVIPCTSSNGGRRHRR